MSEHTPGPWTIRFGLNVMGKDVRYPSQERLVANAGGHANNIWNEQVTAENEANARLIAAAPDLLEALKEILAAGESYVDSADEVKAMLRFGRANDAARAAIAKAEGR